MEGFRFFPAAPNKVVSKRYFYVQLRAWACGKNRGCSKDSNKGTWVRCFFIFSSFCKKNSPAVSKSSSSCLSHILIILSHLIPLGLSHTGQETSWQPPDNHQYSSTNYCVVAGGCLLLPGETVKSVLDQKPCDGLVAIRLPQLPIVCMEDASLSANTRSFLDILTVWFEFHFL